VNLALTNIGNKSWIGGTTYLKNFSGIVNTKLKEKISLHLISEVEQIDINIKKNFCNIINFKKIKSYKLLFFLSFKFNKIANKYNIDVFFESTQFLGFFCNKKVVSWMPDFQHKYYPEYFNFFNYYKRELLFIIKLLIRDRILLSSENAKNDCLKFYKVDPKKLYVAPFSIDLDPSNYIDKKEYLKKKYNITNNFFYIPNQFWRHKNHNLIFNFLDQLSENKEKYDTLPQFIFTGLSEDNRNKNFSNKLINRMNHTKYNKKVMYLGLVPLDDVYTLNANCIALINPSFFEGWSTTVEEAKSLGTKMLLSDIQIHREQSPNAFFFDPKSINNFSEVIFNFINDKKNLKYSRNLEHIKNYVEKRKIEYSNAIEKAFKF
tara:strand:+ start:331 stop:1458 length:1128 start_codon:yes stop_codon:yes gene_type:complete